MTSGLSIALSLFLCYNIFMSTRALIFDSYFDDYRGVVLYVRIFEGKIDKNAEILMMAAGTKGLALEVGILTPKMSPKDSLEVGEIGYIVTNLKTTREAKVGDTVTLARIRLKKLCLGIKMCCLLCMLGFSRCQMISIKS